MLLQDIVRQVSVDLNDYAPGHEFTTWSDTQLTAYVIEGLRVAFSFRPDLFLTTKVVKLEPGTVVQRPCDCTQIRRILGVSTKDGRVLYTIRKKKQSDALTWNGPKCFTDPKYYKVREYSIDAEGDNLLIEPAPPAGQDIYVLVECASLPDDNSDVPDELAAAAIQWALHRAKMMDSENNATIFNVAKEHKATFFSLLQIQQTAKDMIEADSKQTAIRTSNA